MIQEYAVCTGISTQIVKVIMVNKSLVLKEPIKIVVEDNILHHNLLITRLIITRFWI